MWSVSRNKEEMFKIERAKNQIVCDIPPPLPFGYHPLIYTLEKSTLEKKNTEEKHTGKAHWRKAHLRNGNISPQISSGTKESGCHPLKETSVPHPPILISTEEDETIFLLLLLAAVSLPVMFSLWYIYTTCHSICNFHLKLSRVVKSPLPAILAVKCTPWRKRATPPLYNATLYQTIP